MATERVRTLLHRAALPAMLLLASAEPAAAQLITGKVVEEGTDRGVTGATIELMDTTGRRRGTAVSDTGGSFNIMVPEPGPYRLRVSHIAYTTSETSTIEASAGTQVEVELRVSLSAVALEPLFVVGRSSYNAGWLQEFYDRAARMRRSGIGRVYFRDEVERANVPAVSAFLTSLMPRGGCTPTLFVDGLPVQSARDLDSMMPPELLEGVELYNNAAFLPNRYANRGYCAIALFWTRRDLEGAKPFTWRRVFAAGGIFAALFLLFQL